MKTCLEPWLKTLRVECGANLEAVSPEATWPVQPLPGISMAKSAESVENSLFGSLCPTGDLK